MWNFLPPSLKWNTKNSQIQYFWIPFSVESEDEIKHSDLDSLERFLLSWKKQAFLHNGAHFTSLEEKMPLKTLQATSRKTKHRMISKHMAEKYYRISEEAPLFCTTLRLSKLTSPKHLERKYRPCSLDCCEIEDDTLLVLLCYCMLHLDFPPPIYFFTILEGKFCTKMFHATLKLKHH